MRRLAWPLAGSLTALIVSPLWVVLTGIEELSALMLLPVIVLLWILTRTRRAEMGLRIGRGADYGLAALHTLAVMAAIAGAAWLAGEVTLSSTGGRLLGEIALAVGVGWIGVLITEEGFFRGWLWASLERTGMRPARVLIWTSVVFMLWHIPVALIEEGFTLPLPLVPLYLGNVLLLGLAWGLFRMASGSVLVATFSHTVWNAFSYTFFGFGVRVRALGIEPFEIYDPERGLLGLGLNLSAAAVLLWICRRRGKLG